MARSPCGGIVRDSKRPPGWLPPGPKPAGPQDRPDLWPAQGEDLCFLTGQWRIFQLLKGHRYSLDDVATAWTALQVAQGRQIERAADIGSGIGSVLMMVAWGLPHARSIGVEAQDISVDLARRSILYNGIEGRVEARLGDLRDPEMIPEGAVFDLVTGTPPYIAVGDGIMSERAQCGPCRFELRGGVEDYCLAAARLLAPQGRFVVCQAAAQRQRVLDSATAAGLHVLSLRDFVPREGRDPLFAVFVMAREGEEDGGTVVETPLMVRDGDGARTEDYLGIRRDMGMP